MIANLNGQIQRVTVTGENPNDLMDQREQLIEQVSAIVPTTVLTQPDGTTACCVGGVDLVFQRVRRTMSLRRIQPPAGHAHVGHGSASTHAAR